MIEPFRCPPKSLFELLFAHARIEAPAFGAEVFECKRRGLVGFAVVRFGPVVTFRTEVPDAVNSVYWFSESHFTSVLRRAVQSISLDWD